MFLSLMSRGNVCLSCFYDNHFQFSKIFITHKPESQFPKLNKKQFWGFSLKWRGIERKPWKNRSSWVLLTSLQYSTHRRMLPLFPTHPDVVWIRNVLIGTCIRALVPSWWAALANSGNLRRDLAGGRWPLGTGFWRCVILDSLLSPLLPANEQWRSLATHTLLIQRFCLSRIAMQSGVLATVTQK